MFTPSMSQMHFIRYISIHLLIWICLLKSPSLYADQSEISIQSGFSLWMMPVKVDHLQAKNVFMGGDIDVSLGLTPKITILSKSHYSQSSIQDLMITPQQNWAWYGNLWQQYVILEYKPSDQITPIIGLGLGVQRLVIDGWKEITVNHQKYQGQMLNEKPNIQPLLYLHIGMEWRFLSQASCQFSLQSNYFHELNYGLFFNISIYRYLELF